jgi:hypothetical protein
MNAQAQRVDVLAVMGHCLETVRKIADALPGDARAALFANDIVNARAAVAGLIAASQAIDERIAYYASLGENQSPNIEQWAYTDRSGDIARLRKALALAGGRDHG